MPLAPSAHVGKKLTKIYDFSKGAGDRTTDFVCLTNKSQSVVDVMGKVHITKLCRGD